MSKVAVTMKTSWDPASIGDTLVAFNVVVAFAYMAMVLIYTKRDDAATVFDPLWLRDGFCISNRDTPYWNSHDLCLYSDTVMAVLIAVAYFSLRSKRSSFANEVVGGAILSVLGHGLGHGYGAHVLRQGKPMQSFQEEETMAEFIPKFLFGTFIFWGPILKSVLPRVSVLRVLPLALMANAGSMALPEMYLVTYVQTVLFCVASSYQLMRPRDERNTIAYPIYYFTFLPITFSALLESTQCKSILGWGGHLIYDMSIAFAILLPYLFLPNTSTVVDSPKKTV